jgi:hypothetical protein
VAAAENEPGVGGKMEITDLKEGRRLRAAILAVVENQMRENDPPETNQTYQRLILAGHGDEEARRLIGCIVASEVFEILRKNEVFSLARFVQALNRLPELPAD